MTDFQKGPIMLFISGSDFNLATITLHTLILGGSNGAKMGDKV